MTEKRGRQKTLRLVRPFDADVAERELFKVWELAHHHAMRWEIGNADAEDIADTVMDNVAAARKEKPSFLADAAALERFVFTAVKNLALNALRDEKPFVQIEAVQGRLAVHGGTVTPSAEAEPDPRIEFIYKQAEQLPKRCREVWYLKYHEDLERQEVAALLGLSVRTVDAHVYNAMKQIREAIANESKKDSGDPS